MDRDVFFIVFEVGFLIFFDVSWKEIFFIDWLKWERKWIKKVVIVCWYWYEIDMLSCKDIY